MEGSRAFSLKGGVQGGCHPSLKLPPLRKGTLSALVTLSVQPKQRVLFLKPRKISPCFLSQKEQDPGGEFTGDLSKYLRVLGSRTEHWADTLFLGLEGSSGGQGTVTGRNEVLTPMI